MNATLRTTLIVLAVLGLAGLLLVAGVFVGRAAGWANGPYAANTGWGGMMGYGNPNARGSYGSGMMGGGMMGYGNQYGRNNDGYGYGMMGGGGMMGGYGGMMGFAGSSGLSDVEPLTIDEAEKAVTGYLAALGDEDLELGQIMIFDNHAYAQIVESSTGIGAMEVLVDPVTREVYPEYGPNMMWNLKYGMMSGFGGYGMMGGMMGGYVSPGDLSSEMTVTPEEAVQAAQAYLDRYLSGATADDHADAFYGYYTLHVLRDGKIVGMLSVNGFTGQVFLHTWHGDFIEMSGE